MSPVINQYICCCFLYICFSYSSKINWTCTVCRHDDRYRDSGKQIAFTIYNPSWVCLALDSPWKSDHGKLVFPGLRGSRLDPGTWNMVPLIFWGNSWFLLRASLPFANCNTNFVLICKGGSFVYLASMSLIILVMNLFQRTQYRKTEHCLFLMTVIIVTKMVVPKKIYICVHICIKYSQTIYKNKFMYEHVYIYICTNTYIHTCTHICGNWIFFLKFNDIQWSSLWCMKSLQSDDHFPHES